MKIKYKYIYKLYNRFLHVCSFHKYTNIYIDIYYYIYIYTVCCSLNSLSREPLIFLFHITIEHFYNLMIVCYSILLLMHVWSIFVCCFISFRYFSFFFSFLSEQITKIRYTRSVSFVIWLLFFWRYYIGVNLHWKDINM